MVGNKRGVKIQASTTVRCPWASAVPHPHTFGNTKFGSKHSSRFRTLKITDATKVKFYVIKKLWGGWLEAERWIDRWLILRKRWPGSTGLCRRTCLDAQNKQCLLLEMGACWWPGGQRCAEEPLAQRLLNKVVSWGRWRSSWAGCVAGVLFHILTGDELLLWM